VEKMAFPKEKEEKQFRVIYEALYDKPRIFKNEMGELLHIHPNSASSKMKKAFRLGWVSNPQIRLRSYANLKEFAYFLKCENSAKYFSEFVNNGNITYHALTGGSANLWVVSREKLDLSCSEVISGPRSDYHISFAPDQPWDTAIEKMHNMVKEFNPKDYEPQGIIKTHWNETIEWDSEYEKLFREFNYDLTKPITPIMRNNLISWTKVDKWMKNLSTHCTIMTFYYPGRIGSYDPYLLIMKTDYEDFIVNLFSELPTTTLFFTVSDRLFAYIHVKREYIRVTNSQIHINRLHIPNLLMDMLDRGIILSECHGIVECYWNSNL
jgi:hypothetical protein